MLMQKMRNPYVMKWGMWIVLGITIPSFVLFYGFGNSNTPRSADMSTLATVNTDDGKIKISPNDVEEAENMYTSEMVRTAMNYGLINQRMAQEVAGMIRRDLKPKEKVDFAVSQAALRKRLEKQGIRVTDQQVSRQLVEQKLTREQLNQYLKSQSLSEFQYAAMLRSQIAEQEAANTVSRLARTSLIELYNNYVSSSEVIDVTIARIPVQQDAAFNPTEEEIAARYKELVDAKAPSTIQPEQRIYNFVKLTVPPSPAAKPTDEDLKAEFDKSPADDPLLKVPAAITMRQVLASFAPDADDAAKTKAREKAQQALNRINGGEDLSAVANALTDDPSNVKPGDANTSSTLAGGLLPYTLTGGESMIFGEKYMEFAKTAELNKVSDILETPRGYVVARVEKREPEARMNFEQARSVLTRRVQERLTQQATDARNIVASQKLKEMRDAVRQETSLDGIARVVNSDVKSTSPTTTLSTFISGAGSFTASADAIKNLKAKRKSDVLQNSNLDPVILEVKEVIPSRVRELSEIRQLLVSNIRQKKAETEAKAKAEALKARVVAGDSLTSAATQMQLTAEVLPPFARGAEANTIAAPLQNLNDVNAALASAQKGEVRILTEGSADYTLAYVVFNVTGTQTPSLQDFVKNIRNIEAATLQFKREAFLAEFRRDAVAKANIEYNPVYVPTEESKKKKSEN